MSLNNSTPKSLGVTSPISNVTPKPEDLERTAQLEKCLRSFELFEDDEQMQHRIYVLGKIHALVQRWVKEISEKKVPPATAATMTGKIFSFGSYRLGVHTKG